ncbi:SMI1/KNR4 family protein [Xenorhabdus bharatensis]|uniref:SMI1/KNR4 family protein n=1 Tax=Xenorhabdus bharatensis TaxID=3136256 RepID=UPI0030F3E7F0
MGFISNFFQKQPSTPVQARLEINRTYPNDQVKRVRLKLPLALKVDKKFELFAADRHKYELNPPIEMTEIHKWQKRTGAQLPEDFILFLTQIGNGGAGPYYGIARFEDSESRYDQTAALPSILSPTMSDQEWQAISQIDDDCSDEEYDERYNLLHQGVFYLGTCGCEYDLLLVITGEYAGRILYTHHWCDSEKPYFFSYEKNFLDWYERWLDEVIQEYNTGWFGHCLGGDEDTLLASYQNVQTNEERIQVIKGFHKLPMLSEKGADILERIVQQEHNDVYPYALKTLAQFAPERTTCYLLDDLKNDDNNIVSQAAGIVFFHHKANLKLFQQQLLETLAKSTDINTVRFIGYILKELNAVEVEQFMHLFSCADKDLASTAIYAASNDALLNQKIALFFEVMVSDDERVALIAIQTLAKTRQHYEEALPFLEQAWFKYPTEKNEYIRSNITSYLRDIGTSVQFSRN